MEKIIKYQIFHNNFVHKQQTTTTTSLMRER